MAFASARSAGAGEFARPPSSLQLEIRSDPAKGRGVVAIAPIAAGTLIEAAPVIIVPATQCVLLDRTVLHDYYFRWGEAADAAAAGAVALGLVSLCNHARRPRARVRRNDARRTLDLIALVPVAAGEEITIDYSCRLWFEAKD